jgi:ABC-type oligopeptide transport system substrate-binding subunit
LSSKLVSPIISSQFVIIKRATVIDRLTVRFDFVTPDNSAPLIAGDLPIFSPKWGVLPDGKRVPFDQMSMEPVIGSGAYVVDQINGNHDEPLRNHLPASVFGPVAELPSTIAMHSLRDNLKEARVLLSQAGWNYQDGALRNAKGEPFTIEIIDGEPGMERIYAVLVRNLALLGIDAHLREIDAALFLKRSNDFDYDMLTEQYLPARIPGQEMERRFSSRTADEKGSENYVGAHSSVIIPCSRPCLRPRPRMSC